MATRNGLNCPTQAIFTEVNPRHLAKTLFKQLSSKHWRRDLKMEALKINVFIQLRNFSFYITQIIYFFHYPLLCVVSPRPLTRLFVFLTKLLSIFNFNIYIIEAVIYSSFRMLEKWILTGANEIFLSWKIIYACLCMNIGITLLPCSIALFCEVNESCKEEKVISSGGREGATFRTVNNPVRVQTGRSISSELMPVQEV